MNRRQFFSRTAGTLAAAALAQATPAKLPAHLPVDFAAEGMLAIDRLGHHYRYVRASRSMRVGDFAMHGNTPLCVAVAPIKKGQYGWLQIGGAAVVNRA